jgi:hypothetical protein
LTFKKTHHKNQIDGFNLGTFTHNDFGGIDTYKALLGIFLMRKKEACTKWGFPS